MRIQSLTAATALFLAAVVPTAGATQINEVEINNPINAAQYLFMPADPLTISAVLGGGIPADVDYFTFNGRAGDVVTLDIDGGYTATQHLDTVLAVFGPAPGYTLLRMNDDAWPIDPGSVSALDARIDNFVLPQTGQYTVGVSNYPRYFNTGGSVRTGTPREGSYKLVISGVTPEVRQVAIEIKPGSGDLAPVNPNSRGRIPVAILSGPDFDPATVDTGSLTFGATGEEPSLARCTSTGEDLNGDGTADLICHFDNRKAGFRAGDLEGILRGRTVDGGRIEGRGFLKVVPQKSSRIPHV